MIGKKVFLTDDLGDGEMLMCSDTVTAILIEENSMSVRCKTSGDEFWTVGKNAFFSEIADTFIVYTLFIASNKCDDLLNKGLMDK